MSNLTCGSSVLIIGAGPVGFWSAATMKNAGFETLIVSSSISPGPRRILVEGDSNLEALVNISSQVDPSFQPSMIFLTKPAQFLNYELEQISVLPEVPAYTFANGLLPFRVNRFVLNCAVSCPKALKNEMAVHVRAVGTSYLKDGFIGERIRDAFQRANLPVKTVKMALLDQVLNRKIALNAIANGISSVSGMTMGEIAVNTAIHDFTDALAQENCDLLGLDYETLGHREWLRKGTTHIPSTAANVLAGRSHDLAFLNGALVTKAKQLQAKASANELIMELVAERRLLKPWLIAARFEGIRILA